MDKGIQKIISLAISGVLTVAIGILCSWWLASLYDSALIVSLPSIVAVLGVGFVFYQAYK